MRVVERYPRGLKAFRGKGIWVMLSPLRYILAVLYRVFLFTRKDGEEREDSPDPLSDSSRPMIISVGNLEAGGSGKTPVTIFLADRIRKNGGRVAVVTRGYGSLAEKTGRPVVVTRDIIDRSPDEEGYLTCETLIGERSGGWSGDPEKMAGAVGDEVMIYRNLDIPVVIDPDRRRGTAMAVSLFGPTHILMDDAFQHRSARRDLDILLLDHSNPFGNGWLLPAGTLREPPSAAGRADAIVFTRARGTEIPGSAEKYLADKPVFFASYVPSSLVGRDGEVESISLLDGREIVLFSGIARPESFEESAGMTGAEIISSYRFIDHHRYSQDDIDMITGESAEGTIFVTTEKDMSKVCRSFPSEFDLYALRIELELTGKRPIEELM